jgi:hypothetical protein
LFAEQSGSTAFFLFIHVTVVGKLWFHRLRWKFCYILASLLALVWRAQFMCSVCSDIWQQRLMFMFMYHVNGLRLFSELWPPAGLLFIPQIYDWKATVEWYWRENRRTRRKTCPSATLSTTNPTWTDLGVNPGLCGERPATNCLSHVTAKGWSIESCFDIE